MGIDMDMVNNFLFYLCFREVALMNSQMVGLVMVI